MSEAPPTLESGAGAKDAGPTTRSNGREALEIGHRDDLLAPVSLDALVLPEPTLDDPSPEPVPCHPTSTLRSSPAARAARQGQITGTKITSIVTVVMVSGRPRRQ